MTSQSRQCVVNSSVDLSIIRSWLQQCDQEHGDPTSNHLLSTQSKYLRLYDLKKQCLIKAPINARYVTLNYQQGRHSDIYSNSSTAQAYVEERQQANGLKLTIYCCNIRLEMHCLLRSWLGEKFVRLWICIIKTAVKTREKQIKHMSSVYSKF